MALNVTGNFEQDNGLSVDSAYGRTNAILSLDGSKVSAYPEFWKDEAAYTAGLTQIQARFDLNFVYDYDRAVDGADLLTFANDKVAEDLRSLGYEVQIVEIDG